MDFLHRAKKALDRGDAVRGLVQLVEGLRRNPDRDDALDLLLYVYTRQIDHPGVESDVLRALEGHPSRGELLGLLEAELHERQKSSMARALVQLAREQDVEVVAPRDEDPADEGAPAEAGAGEGQGDEGDEPLSAVVAADGAAARVLDAGESSWPEGGAKKPLGEGETSTPESDPVEVQRAQVMRREVGLPTTAEIERRHPRRPPKRRAALLGVLLVLIVVVGISTWVGWDHARRLRLMAAIDAEIVSLNHLDITPVEAVLREATRGHRDDREIAEREAFVRAVRAAEYSGEELEREAIAVLLGDEVLTDWGMAARSLLASASGRWEHATEYAVLAERTHPARLAALYARGRLCEARSQWSCAQGAYQRVLGQHPQFGAARAAMMRVAAHRYDRALWEHHHGEWARGAGEHCYAGLGWVDPFEESEEARVAEEVAGQAQGQAPGQAEDFCLAWGALAQAVEGHRVGGAWDAVLVEAALGRTPALALAQVVAGLARAQDYEPEAARDYFIASISDPGLRVAFYRRVQVSGPRALVALARPDLALALTLPLEETPGLLADAEAQARFAALARREAARPAHLSVPPETIGPLEAQALLSRAQVLRELGAAEQALRAAEQLLPVEGWADLARQELVRVHVVAGRQRAARTALGQIQDESRREAAQAWFSLAAGDFEKVVERPLQSTRWEDRRSRALSYLALKRGRDASAVLDSRLALQPTRLRVYSRLDELPESFARDMERWNQVDPRGVSHLIDLGAAAFWRRDLERAGALFERAYGLAPEHPEVNWHLGLLARLDGADARARAYFRKSWRGDENDASLLIELGRVHLDFERYEMAREAFLLAVLRDRRSVAAVAGLGRAYELGDPARGRRDLRQLLGDYSSSPRYAPAVAEMNTWLAILHGARQGDEEAAIYLNRAREVVGDRADVLVELGRYHLARAEFDSARESFVLAMQKNPTLPAPHWGLAQLALEAGELERAGEHLNRLESLQPGDSWSERAQELRARLDPARSGDAGEGPE